MRSRGSWNIPSKRTSALHSRGAFGLTSGTGTILPPNSHSTVHSSLVRGEQLLCQATELRDVLFEEDRPVSCSRRTFRHDQLPP